MKSGIDVNSFESENGEPSKEIIDDLLKQLGVAEKESMEAFDRSNVLGRCAMPTGTFGFLMTGMGGLIKELVPTAVGLAAIALALLMVLRAANSRKRSDDNQKLVTRLMAQVALLRQEESGDSDDKPDAAGDGKPDRVDK